MAKVTGFNRKRIGRRNNLASFDAPPTAVNEYGQVEHTTGNWTRIVTGWPCEMVDAGGGEVVNGFQTTAKTQKVLAGDPALVANVTEACRCVINGVTYGITAVRDVSGDGRTKRIELRGIK